MYTIYIYETACFLPLYVPTMYVHIHHSTISSLTISITVKRTGKDKMDLIYATSVTKDFDLNSLCTFIAVIMFGFYIFNAKRLNRNWCRIYIYFYIPHNGRRFRGFWYREYGCFGMWLYMWDINLIATITGQPDISKNFIK